MEIPVFHKGDKLSETNNDLKPVSFLLQTIFKVHTNVLSFYRSQNVLCWFKSFLQDQKSIYILWQSQTFCGRKKKDLHSVKLIFVLAQKVLKSH